MAKTKDRSSRYWEKRLARDHPAVLAELRAGKFASLREAAVSAGVLKRPTPYDLLRRAWTRASRSERTAFLYFAKGTLRSGGGSVSALRAKPLMVDHHGHLTPLAKTMINDELARTGLRAGQFTRDVLRLPTCNTTIATGLRGWHIRNKRTIRALEAWRDRTLRR